MCPGHDESAGKRRRGKTRTANRYLRAALIQSALGASHAKGTALQARYHRVKRHRGHKKAIVAVGHQLLEIAYYVMRDGVTYDELGADYFDRRHADRAVRRHVRQLEALGFQVTIEKAA
jgi:transposase